MFSKIILLEDYISALDTGIVSISYDSIIIDNDSKTNYSFYTRNVEFIAHLTGDDVEEVQAELEMVDSVSDIDSNDVLKVGAYNILERKFTSTFFSDITGEILFVSSLTKPKESHELVNAKIYLGNETGAVSVTDSFLKMTQGKDKNMMEYGFKDDKVAIVFDTCLAYEEGFLPDDIFLKGIHIRKS